MSYNPDCEFMFSKMKWNEWNIKNNKFEIALKHLQVFATQIQMVSLHYLLTKLTRSTFGVGAMYAVSQISVKNHRNHHQTNLNFLNFQVTPSPNRDVLIETTRMN